MVCLKKNIAYEFVSAFPAEPTLSISSYLDGLCDGRLVAVELLFFEGMICSKEHCPILPIFCHFLRVQVVQPYSITDTTTVLKKMRLFYQGYQSFIRM